MSDLAEEMAEGNFSNFRKRIDKDLEDQEEFEVLR
jgi:hypothetical protein